MSAINTRTYKLAKFLVPILKCLTSNEYIAKYSFDFTDNVDSIFTKIPLEETINICINTIFENTGRIEDLSKIEFNELLILVTESYFILNENLCQQVD